MSLMFLHNYMQTFMVVLCGCTGVQVFYAVARVCKCQHVLYNTCACVLAYVRACVSARMYAYSYVYTYIRTYVYTYVCTYVRTCMYVIILMDK